ncbi:MAG: hypothetical protein WAT58_13185, partial [Candidatus Dormiibacterota bacterium]
MKTTLRMASATLAVTTALGGLALTPPLVASAACDPATRAVQYLAANQKTDGSLDMSSAGGFGNPGASMDFAVGAAAIGIDPNTVHKTGGQGLYDYLAAQAPGAAADAGKTAKLLLALAAGNTPAGKFDYHGFGGQDLLTKLTSDQSATPAGFYHSTGVATGSYGDGSTFAQALAILAVKATGGTAPAAAVTWLKGLENQGVTPDTQATGFTFKGWSSAAVSNAAQGDTNSTAVALQALTAAGDNSRNTAALAWLHTQQNTDGGFPFQAPSAFGTASDADSDALVLAALAATGQAVSNWQVSGNSPLGNLLSMEDAGGGFSTPLPDTFTTSQVPPALVGKALPINAPTAGVVVPAAGCPVASG